MQRDYPSFMTEFKVLYRRTLDLSRKSEEKDRFETKLRDIALPFFKF